MTKKPIPQKHPEKVLTAAAIRNAKPGRHADGNGLYLMVEPSGAKHWVLRTVVHGKRCDIGLGGLRLVSLAEAREEAARLRKIARKNGDPLAERRKERSIMPIFEDAAREAHKSYAATFKARHANRWIVTLEQYAFPIFGKTPVDAITPNDILRALSPIWIEKPDTARRVKQRIASIFTWCKAKGYSAGNNPTEGIEQALPKINGKIKEHHAALPFAQVPEFIAAMRQANIADSVKLAFEFLIHTAARTSEVIFAKWEEIDLEARTWIVPAARMKMKIEHRVPLTTRCLEILKEAKELANSGEYIFPGRSPRKPLSNMAFLMALRRMERTDITPHGFRSSFRDWAEEKTNTQRSVVEAALAHQVESKTEGAYLRTTLFDKRRRLMDSWTTFATAKPTAKIVKIRG
jgi:integrase